MGTWNGTCGITQLPIFEEQRIAAIPLIVKQQDFLARDSLTGSCSVENDLIAQPIAPAMFGTYHGSGCINPDAEDRGEALLQSLLERLVSKERLLSKETSRPEVLTELPEDWLDLLHRGELMVSVENHRKQWLLNLKKTIAESDNPTGYSHYMPQLKEDPALLPDTFALPLGVMFVAEPLYHQLATAAGDVKDDYGIARAGRLQAWSTCTEEKAEKVRAALIEITEDELSPDEVTATTLSRRASAVFQSVVASKAVDVHSRYFYFPDAIAKVLEAALFQHDKSARQYWISSVLFMDAMSLMRKQWTVQAGGGSSAGLEISKELYEVTARFMESAIAAE